MEEIQNCSLTLLTGFSCLQTDYVTAERPGLSIRNHQESYPSGAPGNFENLTQTCAFCASTFYWYLENQRARGVNLSPWQVSCPSGKGKTTGKKGKRGQCCRGRTAAGDALWRVQCFWGAEHERSRCELLHSEIKPFTEHPLLSKGFLLL